MAGRIARENRGEIKAEAINVHLFDPVAETIEDHPANDWMIGVKRISGAAVIGIPRAVRFENIIRAVVQAAEAQRRAVVAAFRSVVEDHIENDLDPGAMQRFDHVAKLVHRAERIPARAVGLVRRKKRDRRVTPIIDQSRRGNPERRTETRASIRRL